MARALAATVGYMVLGRRAMMIFNFFVWADSGAEGERVKGGGMVWLQSVVELIIVQVPRIFLEVCWVNGRVG